ncbi:hypothetical protein BRD03_02590 [Halobacteriales archaeon QS_9_68_17]|nr:MAG: hypothetical protein BRD03_02590 [Halobacteriales archaeon QS_9_68_17]
MTFDRRDFVKATGASVVGTGLLSGTAAAQSE